jgi:hypothetical protein
MTKCRFAFAQLHALGHKVSGLQLTISDNHLAAVRDLPTPHDVTSLRSVLGFAAWQPKIPNFNIIAMDLYVLRSGERIFLGNGPKLATRLGRRSNDFLWKPLLSPFPVMTFRTPCTSIQDSMA